jgi:hypothetical protein
MAIRHLQQHALSSTTSRELVDLQPLLQSPTTKASGWWRRGLRYLYQALLFWSVPYSPPAEPHEVFLMECERQCCQYASLWDGGFGVWVYLLYLRRFTKPYLAEEESCG